MHDGYPLCRLKIQECPPFVVVLISPLVFVSMFFHLKIYTLSNVGAKHEPFLGAMNGFEIEPISLFQNIIKDVGAWIFHSLLGSTKRKCRIQVRMESLNTIMPDVYVILLEGETMRVPNIHNWRALVV